MEELVRKVDPDARDLAKPYDMLHRLAMDVLETRGDDSKKRKATKRELKRRCAQLKDVKYWNCIAGAFAQYKIWLKLQPDFFNSDTAPPFPCAENYRIMALELKDVVRNLGKCPAH